MGWFLPSHMDSGFIFGLLGLWHLFSIMYSFITNPRGFRCKAWFPALIPKVPRALELWILLFIVVIFILKQLSHATGDIASGVIHTEHLMRFQHVAFSFMYLVYIVAALVGTETRFLPLPEGALQATFALGFLCELIVFHFGHHPGDNLESYVHMIMQLVLAALVILMFLEIGHPTSVVLSLARSICLILKGTWFFYIGVLINVPSSIPNGCAIADGADFPTCELPMDRMRAKAIQILIFICQAVAIVLFAFVEYAVLMWIFGDASKHADYELIDDEVRLYSVVDVDSTDDPRQAGVPVLKNFPRSLSRRKSDRTTPTSLQIPSLLAIPGPNMPTVLSPLAKNIKNV